jgi:hypothetical protein
MNNTFKKTPLDRFKNAGGGLMPTVTATLT